MGSEVEMGKGVRVIALVLAYCVATWVLQGHAWSPPALLTPQAAAPLLRPFRSVEPPVAPSPSPRPAAPPVVVPAVHAPSAEPPAEGVWAGFLEKMRALDEGRTEAVRIIHLGDSEIVGDGPTAVLRDRLGERFGLGGLGFGAASSPVRWYEIDRWSHHEGRGLSARTYPLGKPGQGRYGPGGVAFEARAGAHASVRLDHDASAGCRLRFFYDRRPDGGEVALSLDGQVAARIATAGERALAAETLERRTCPRELALRTSGGYTTLFGWSVDYDQPGVVYSTLGVVGAQLRHLSSYEPAHLAASLRALEPDLVVLAFGLNLASMQVPPPPSYEPEIAAVLETIRSGLPDAACLLVGPYPVGKAEGSHPEARNARRLTSAQRAAAERAGCAFVDRFHLAGGPAAATRWRSTHPRILSGDYRHLTHYGATRMGQALATTLLSAIDGAPPPPRAFLLETR